MTNPEDIVKKSTSDFDQYLSALSDNELGSLGEQLTDLGGKLDDTTQQRLIRDSKFAILKIVHKELHERVNQQDQGNR